MDKWIITYAKINMDKSQGIILNGVYFGGITYDNDHAEQVAKECVNSIRGGTILPKIIKMSSDSIVDALVAAEDKFGEMINRMRDADNTINRGGKRR